MEVAKGQHYIRSCWRFSMSKSNPPTLSVASRSPANTSPPAGKGVDTLTFGGCVMDIITIDIETYYDKDYSCRR